MSRRDGGSREAFGGRVVALCWLSLGLLCVAYIAARSSSSPGLFVAAQFIFLVPVVGSALLTLEAYRVAPVGDERRVWGLLSVAAWLLLGSEGYYAWYQLAVNPSGPAAPSINDAFNVAAAGTFLVVLTFSSGLARYPVMARMRFYSDAVAVVSLSLMVLFRFWSGDLAGQVGWREAVLWATYTFLGVAVLGALLWLGAGLRASEYDQRRNLVIGASVGIFAVGIILAPFAQQPPSDSGSVIGATGVLMNTLFMTGYCLMAIAAVMRILDRRQPWQSVMSRPRAAESERTTGIMSLCVLIAVCIAGVWAFQAPSTEESTVYFLLGVAATLAMVARTAALTYETGALQDSARADPLTGVGNRTAFEEQLESTVLLRRRLREPFVLAILNLDDFTRVNEALGRSVGDGALVRVGTALKKAGGRRGEVFRLSGDEFALIVGGVGVHDRLPIGTALLGAISGIELDRGLRLSASVGVSSCEDEECTSGSILHEADAAQVWAKYHGKGRVVVHDERIVHALGIEERVRLNDERLHFDVARALAAAADARDPRGFYHSRNVSALAVLLGEASGLSESQLGGLEIAAMLHDVGQIALPDELVVGPLTRSRRIAAREHAILGAQLVQSMNAPSVSAGVRNHHERWDGCGYPDGLAGEEIAIEARIIALADAYDGMTSGRRSGTVMSRAAALQEIDHALGTRFDPHLSEEFIRLVGTTSALGWSDEWAVLE